MSFHLCVCVCVKVWEHNHYKHMARADDISLVSDATCRKVKRIPQSKAKRELEKKQENRLAAADPVMVQFFMALGAASKGWGLSIH